MFYWLYYYFNRHVGDSVVKTTGRSPYYTGLSERGLYKSPKAPVLITISEDRKTLFVIAANGTWDEDIPLVISLKGGKPGRSEQVLLSHDNRDASPMLTDTSQLVHSHDVKVDTDSVQTLLPRHSVLFVTMALR